MGGDVPPLDEVVKLVEYAALKTPPPHGDIMPPAGLGFPRPLNGFPVNGPTKLIVAELWCLNQRLHLGGMKRRDENRSYLCGIIFECVLRRNIQTPSFFDWHHPLKYCAKPVHSIFPSCIDRHVEGHRTSLCSLGSGYCRTNRRLHLLKHRTRPILVDCERR